MTLIKEIKKEFKRLHRWTQRNPGKSTLIGGVILYITFASYNFRFTSPTKLGWMAYFVGAYFAYAGGYKIFEEEY